MVTAPVLTRSTSPQTSDTEFFLHLKNDTEQAPWMTAGHAQYWSASAFAYSLRLFAGERGLPWYVACMLPIRFRWPDVPKTKQLSPDVFVAFAADHPRDSYSLAKEPRPAFVLEVMSRRSQERDMTTKVTAYSRLGIAEYALFRSFPDNRLRRALADGRRRPPLERATEPLP